MNIAKAVRTLSASLLLSALFSTGLTAPLAYAQPTFTPPVTQAKTTPVESLPASVKPSAETVQPQDNAAPVDFSKAGALLKEINGNIVIMGDSFSSGEGAARYESQPYQVCHRANTTYVNDLFKGTKHKVINLACSGATTYDFETEQIMKGTRIAAQLDQLAKTSDVGAVFLTIGGNDVGFSQVLLACLEGDCSYKKTEEPDTQPVLQAFHSLADLGYTDSADAAINPDKNRLQKVYQAINKVINSPESLSKRGGKLAPIIVSGYPMMVHEPKDGACNMKLWGINAGTFSVNEIKMGWNLIDSLNATIKAAVNHTRLKAKVPVYYVDNITRMAIPGHTVCDLVDPYFNGAGHLLTIFKKIKDYQNFIQEFYHPNEAGHQAWADRIIIWSQNKTYPNGVYQNRKSPVTTPGLLGKLQTDPRVTTHDIAPKLQDLPDGVNVPTVGAPLEVLPGDTITVKLQKIGPYSPINVSAGSELVGAGVYFADKEGKASFTFKVGDHLDEGNQTLSITSFDSEGKPIGVGVALTVNRSIPLWVMIAGIVFAVYVSILLLGFLVALTIRRRKLKKALKITVPDLAAEEASASALGGTTEIQASGAETQTEPQASGTETQSETPDVETAKENRE